MAAKKPTSTSQITGRSVKYLTKALRMYANQTKIKISTLHAQIDRHDATKENQRITNDEQTETTAQVYRQGSLFELAKNTPIRIIKTGAGGDPPMKSMTSARILSITPGLVYRFST